jgi:hypothetical protein
MSPRCASHPPAAVPSRIPRCRVLLGPRPASLGAGFVPEISRQPSRLLSALTQMSPLGDRLLVKPQEAESKTAGGILLAATSNKSMQDALVGTGEDWGPAGAGLVTVPTPNRRRFSKQCQAPVVQHAAVAPHGWNVPANLLPSWRPPPILSCTS